MRSGPPLPPPAHAAPLPPAVPWSDGVAVRSGLPYAGLDGARPLELDLWLPAGPGPHPVALFLHGGGWRAGSRHSGGPAFPGASLFEAVAAAGIAVASVDYRLSGEATWPTPLHDVKAAVRWLRHRSSELDLDPDRVIAWGESAGGHLALLLGLTADVPALEGTVAVTGPSSAVDAVVAWYPPSDLLALPGDLGTDPLDPMSREAQLLGEPAATDPARAREASPTTYVAPGVPPIRLLHGEADRLIPCVQSRRLADDLRAAGAEVELITYAGADHMWFGSPDAAQDALARTIAELHTRLGR